MTKNWYVMRSKPNREDFLEDQLLARNFEVFYPRVHVKPVNPRSRKHKPYFPGYLFVHTDLEDVGVSNLERVAGAANIVSFGGEVPIVPDVVVHAIRAKLDELNAHGGVQPVSLPTGAVVKVEKGPFEGYEGIVDARIPGRERVRILLRFLQNRRLPVELPVDFVSVKRKP